MNHYIDELWEKIDYDGKTVKETWNQRANAFALRSDDQEHFVEYQDVLKRLESTQDSIVLDIGCASGQHSFNFAKSTKQVIGIDISDQMICFANEKKEQLQVNNVEFMECAWESVDLVKLGWHKKFDLVVANFSPAIHSEDAVLKMCTATKQLGYISQHVARFDPLAKELATRFSTYQPPEMMRDRILAAFNTLWINGYLPEITYDARTTRKTLKEEDFSDYLASHDLADHEEAHDYLKKRMKNGSIEYDVIHTNGILIWDVQDKR